MSERYKHLYLLTVDGAVLTQARINRGLSLEAVVQKMSDGINISTVSRWEQGLLQPSPSRLSALVKLYGTHEFVRLNERAVLTDDEVRELRQLRKFLLKGRIQLNGDAVLWAKEIEVVRKLREG
jgi:transcriptional regulator with XRE-family HTH domain